MQKSTLIKFVADVKKNTTETVRIGLYESGGRLYVDLRVWYAAIDGELRPTTKGIRMRGNAITRLIQGLQDAHQYAQSGLANALAEKAETERDQ